MMFTTQVAGMMFTTQVMINTNKASHGRSSRQNQSLRQVKAR